MQKIREPEPYDVEGNVGGFFSHVKNSFCPDKPQPSQSSSPSLMQSQPTQMQHPQHDPFMMGGSLPPIDYYGQPKQQWDAEMMDRLIDTTIKPIKDENGNPLPKPKLWLFQTEAFRHLQLTNLRSRDQTEIERDIADIHMLSNQDGNEELCEEMQLRVYSKLMMFKSRSDLPIQHRERDAWFTNVTEMKQSEIKRPNGSGGFFSDLLGRRNRGWEE